MSIGTGKTMVDALSPAMAVRALQGDEYGFLPGVFRACLETQLTKAQKRQSRQGSLAFRFWTGSGRSDNPTIAGTGRGTGFSGPNTELAV